MKISEFEMMNIDSNYVINKGAYKYSNDETSINLSALTAFKRSSRIIRYINLIVKRLIDIVGALVGCIILVPITIVVAIINVLSEDNGSVFYVQERIGKNGKIFAMYKFRTMVVDADEKLKEVLKNDKEARKEYKKYKKLTNDPRITKFGKILRKTSIDEFPQFINVLKGEMSLVGPRPYLTREKEDMGKAYLPIITIRPGITGLWQTNGRSNVTFEERLNMDLEYYQKNNVSLDIEILIKTVSSVFGKEGAE